MIKLIRLFAVVLVAVFAAGTAVHTAKSAAMSATMTGFAPAMMPMMDTDMGDCDGCPADDDAKGSRCIDFCLASFAAIPAIACIEVPFTTPDLPALPVDVLASRTVPPDPDPPRTIIL